MAKATAHIEKRGLTVANVIHRTREEGVYDGSTGSQIDTTVYHEIGVEIEGVFVPFATKQGSYVDALVDRGKAAQKAEQHTPSSGSANPAGAQSGQNIPQAQTGTAGTPSATSSTTGAPQSPQVPTEPQQSTGETAESQ